MTPPTAAMTLAAPCPMCLAPAGQPCTRWAYKEQLPRATCHAARIRAARAVTR